MPYNRYDIKNKYTIHGKRTNEPVVFKTIMLVLLPVIIIGIIVLGGYVAYLSTDAHGNTGAPQATQEEIPLLSNEELLTYVNERYPLDEDFVPSLVSFGGVQVSKALFDDLDKMISAAAKDGVIITVTEGYISYSQQGELYKATLEKMKKDNDYTEIKAESEAKKICPEAGCSESQTGLLLRFTSSEKAESFEKSETSQWLERYAMNYGFVLRYPKDSEDITGRTYDSQLYRYVGKENALNMRRYDMILEEYSNHIASQ
ncbi:MAG: M15 family metallopeptidase [Ruminococcus sp.]